LGHDSSPKETGAAHAGQGLLRSMGL